MTLHLLSEAVRDCDGVRSTSPAVSAEPPLRSEQHFSVEDSLFCVFVGEESRTERSLLNVLPTPTLNGCRVGRHFVGGSITRRTREVRV